MAMSVDLFEEAKVGSLRRKRFRGATREEQGFWRFANPSPSSLLPILLSTLRRLESWRKVEATAMGSSLRKIESKNEKGALMIVHVLSGWLASSYQIRRASLQHIS